MISLPCDSSSVSGCSAVQWRTCSQIIWIFQYLSAASWGSKGSRFKSSDRALAYTITFWNIFLPESFFDLLFMHWISFLFTIHACISFLMNYCCLNFSSMNYSCMHFIFELFLQKFQRISNRSEYCTLSSTDRPAVTGNHIRVRRRQAGLPAVALGAGVGWRSTHHHHEAGQIQQTGARLLAHTAHAHPLTPCGSLALVL